MCISEVVIYQIQVMIVDLGPGVLRLRRNILPRSAQKKYVCADFFSMSLGLVTKLTLTDTHDDENIFIV